MSDDDARRADADFLDHGSKDALAFGDRGGPRGFVKPGQEALQVFGELEVGLLVDELGGQGLQLVVQVLPSGAQGRHPLAQLLQGD
ncbi:hypothetical protein ABIA35_009095 [Catenulispora sp. MAP12-49]|uniref:hypothetical protein n=1 Tax=Catenulispora sp. MAP12-49 TaxID=3156302 RepID=UPI003518B5D9